MVLQTELKKLGLKDKEAAVYIACLELGSAPVQAISRKAKVVRATTYVVLDTLSHQGLVTQYKEGKKTLFSAEPPRQLLRLLEKQREKIEEKESDLEKVLPELQMVMKTADDKPSIRYFEGKEGQRVMRQEFIMYCQRGDEILNFTPADHMTAVFPDDEDTHFPSRVAKGVFSRTIFTTKSDKLRKRWLSIKNSRNTERRFVPPTDFPVSSGMTIYRDRIAMGTFTGKLMGVIIESQTLSNMMRCLFELAWDQAKQYSVIEDNKA